MHIFKDKEDGSRGPLRRIKDVRTYLENKLKIMGQNASNIENSVENISSSVASHTSVGINILNCKYVVINVYNK